MSLYIQMRRPMFYTISKYLCCSSFALSLHTHTHIHKQKNWRTSGVLYYDKKLLLVASLLFLVCRYIHIHEQSNSLRPVVYCLCVCIVQLRNTTMLTIVCIKWKFNLQKKGFQWAVELLCWYNTYNYNKQTNYNIGGMFITHSFKKPSWIPIILNKLTMYSWPTDCNNKKKKKFQPILKNIFFIRIRKIKKEKVHIRIYQFIFSNSNNRT